MKKMLAWLLNFTKVGGLAKKAQEKVEGKKQMLAGLATGIAGTLTIIMKFGEQGLPYLTEIATTPEFLAASGGWVAFFNALKGEKIRQENAQILEKLDQVTPASETPKP